MKNLKSLLLLIVSLAISGCISDESQFSIKVPYYFGFIDSGKFVAIKNLQVTVEDENAQLVKKYTTDADGRVNILIWQGSVQNLQDLNIKDEQLLKAIAKKDLPSAEVKAKLFFQRLSFNETA